MKKWDLILGIMISFYALALITIWGNVAFSYMLLLIGIIGVIHHFIKEKLENLKIYKFIKVMFCVFIIF
ncbi:MAG: YdcF family protein, partial [Clostridium sp.]